MLHHGCNALQHLTARTCSHSFGQASTLPVAKACEANGFSGNTCAAKLPQKACEVAAPGVSGCGCGCAFRLEISPTLRRFKFKSLMHLAFFGCAASLGFRRLGVLLSGGVAPLRKHIKACSRLRIWSSSSPQTSRMRLPNPGSHGSLESMSRARSLPLAASSPASEVDFRRSEPTWIPRRCDMRWGEPRSSSKAVRRLHRPLLKKEPKPLLRGMAHPCHQPAGAAAPATFPAEGFLQRRQSLSKKWAHSEPASF